MALEMAPAPRSPLLFQSPLNELVRLPEINCPSISYTHIKAYLVRCAENYNTLSEYKPRFQSEGPQDVVRTAQA